MRVFFNEGGSGGLLTGVGAGATAGSGSIGAAGVSDAWLSFERRF
jgi:hypothetical protein